MDPQINQKVKIYFRNGIIEEGIVLSWSSKKSAIKSLSSENILVIQNTEQDVFLLKIIIEEFDIKNIYEPEEEIEINIKEPEELRTKKLVELYKKRSLLEKEKVREAMTTFNSNGAASLPEYPQNFKVQYKIPPKAL